MLGFWKASAWLRSRPDPDEDDGQRDLLLPKDHHNILLASLRPRPRDGLPITKTSQQRYVHFGIGGAGNTCNGIPFTVQDDTPQSWHNPATNVTHQPKQQSSSCTAAGTGSSGFWYEKITHNGQSSFLSTEVKKNYPVFRNVVKDFGADNTGQNDAAGAIQSAIEAGASNGPKRNARSMGTTGQPAIVYLPSGTYLMKSSVQFFVGTVLVGDPTNPPVLKAAPDFRDDHIVFAKDPNVEGTNNFYIGLKNVILDSTSVDTARTIALVDWTVSQATQLTNVVFNMPTGSNAHVGLTTQYDYNSNIIVNDLRFNGGAIGMKLNGQQWVFKNLTFSGTSTGVVAGGTNIVFIGCQFENGNIGIDANGTSGSLTIIDSKGSGLNSLVVSANSGGAGNAIILENVENSGTTVSLGNNPVLSGNMPDTWVHGNLYSAGNANKNHVEGQTVVTKRVTDLLVGGKNYFIMPPPTYSEFPVEQVLNIKTVSDKPVYGDGVTDDTQNINDILAQNRDCKVIYFPAGTYIVTDTIFVPANIRIVGDPYASAISASGSKFTDINAVRPMIRFGYPGDIGVLHVSDMMFTVADVLPGCQVVEVNIAGNSQGDVGFWNTHFRIGGAAGSLVETKCQGSPADCKAAWGLLRLTSTSSAYIENMWGWTADHDLDGSRPQTIATGRGLLVEANKATWLVGTGFEHNTLYQYNFQQARNVFSALQQSESPYWQGPGNLLAPAPWDQNLIASDPDYSECAANDATCRMALFELIRSSSNLFLYGGCNWVFFNNKQSCQGDCQQNAIRIMDSSSLYLYGTNTKSTTNMVLNGNTPIAKQSDNAGGWGGVIAAYLYNS
ncbi:hypothetical protein CNMCM8689_001585 [Aspergillus fumigatus]|nr:hypothetical protein CNMCM8689_001585 [Aspergillus fumigatus]